jgi:YVTN family beta-propeller protein
MNYLHRVLMKAAFLGALALSLHIALAQSPPPSTTLLSSRAVAFNPATRKAYVDKASVSFAVDQAIAVDSKANLIYVANTHGNSVTVIDGSNNKVLATLAAGKNPFAISLSPNTGRVFVANMGEPSFAIIDRPTIH